MSDETSRTADIDDAKHLPADVSMGEDFTEPLPTTDQMGVEAEGVQLACAQVSSPSSSTVPPVAIEESTSEAFPSSPSAFDPSLTGEDASTPAGVPPHFTSVDFSAPVSQEVPSAGVGQVQQPKPAVKFGLLTWAIVLVMMGLLLLVAPVAQHIDWGNTIMAIFAVLGVFMLVVALMVALRDRRH